MFWLTGRLGPTKYILPVSWMLFQSPKRMRISGSFMTQRVGSVSTQIRDEEAKFKLCKVRSVQFGQKGIPYINTYDRRTIRYPDPLIKANDTIKLDLETNNITDFIKFDVGNVVMVTSGRNRGRVGVIKNREKHKGSFETIHVQDATGHEFATRLGNVFTIGKGGKAVGESSQGKGYQADHHRRGEKEASSSTSSHGLINSALPSNFDLLVRLLVLLLDLDLVVLDFFNVHTFPVCFAHYM
ncbi:small ribosomal subunit protein eS4 [Malus domestica]|uniref:small ribosomal subunit protein eS4 n=1 Tax=Malus domestica TaxID=3750 RepID=UPI0010AB0F8C|nr:40S ribosomal protein S4-like isoform X1 [Malus domestica]